MGNAWVVGMDNDKNGMSKVACLLPMQTGLVGVMGNVGCMGAPPSWEAQWDNRQPNSCGNGHRV